MTSGPTHRQTPIALFVYNRPTHAELVFESLSRCHRLNECSLHVYCDGPKNPSDKEAVGSARAVAREWAARLNGEVIERENNLGLARSIVSAVTELCESYGRVIVIEDDFVLSPSFLDYMLQALDRYAHENNVLQISAYMYPVRHATADNAFFLPLTTTWGWATWARAWNIFTWDATDALEDLKNPQLRNSFDLEASYPYSAMLEQRLRNENDSWGILFWWAVFKIGGLVLHPAQSLVWVGGFDESGTHCRTGEWPNEEVSDFVARGQRLKDFSFPAKIATDQEAFRRIKNFLKREMNPTLGRRVQVRLMGWFRHSHLEHK